MKLILQVFHLCPPTGRPELDPACADTSKIRSQQGNPLSIEVGAHEVAVTSALIRKPIHHPGSAKDLRAQCAADAAAPEEAVDQEFHAIHPVTECRGGICGIIDKQDMVHAAYPAFEIPDAGADARSEQGIHDRVITTIDRELALSDIDSSCPVHILSLNSHLRWPFPTFARQQARAPRFRRAGVRSAWRPVRMPSAAFRKSPSCHGPDRCKPRRRP